MAVPQPFSGVALQAPGKGANARLPGVNGR